MKLHNVIAVGLAALAGVAYSQEAAAPKGLPAVVQVSEKNPKMGKMMITGSIGSGKDVAFKYFDASQEAEVSRKVSGVAVFFLLTPQDLANTETALKLGELDSARKQLAAVKEKYTAFAGLERNPSERAALLEIKCAIRQLDFEGLKGVLRSVPNPDQLAPEDKGVYVAAGVLSKGTSGASVADIEADIKKIMSSGVGRALNGSSYGWMQYALATAMAAAIPAEEISGTISEGNAAAASKAIDAYCRAGVSSHGVDMELPIDAMKRAQAMLWAMPGVKDYASKGASMDAGKWNKAPGNFRDAVALAYMLKNLYGASGETIDAAEKFYFNPIAPRK